MPFTSSILPTLPRHEPAWWFMFRKNELLVHLIDEQAHIPKVTQPEDLSVRALRTQCLGQLDGIACFSAELEPAENSMPAGMTFQALRPLYNVLPEEIFWIAGRAFQIMNWDRNSQYCGRCGRQTILLAGQRAKICADCQLTIYPRISPAIIVAVIKDQQILLANAPRFPRELYSVIAGFVEPGETFEDCVHREVYEEVGIAVRDIRYFGSQPWPFPDSLMVGFTAHYAGGEIKVDQEEILEAGWFRADKLPDIPGKVSIARKLIDWFVENYS